MLRSEVHLGPENATSWQVLSQKLVEDSSDKRSLEDSPLTAGKWYSDESSTYIDGESFILVEDYLTSRKWHEEGKRGCPCILVQNDYGDIDNGSHSNWVVVEGQQREKGSQITGNSDNIGYAGSLGGNEIHKTVVSKWILSAIQRLNFQESAARCGKGAMKATVAKVKGMVSTGPQS